MTNHDNKSWIWWDLCIGWVYAWLTAHEGTNQGSYKLHQTNVCQTYPCPRQRTRTPNTKNDTELTQAQIHIKPIVSGKTRCALICWAPWEKFDQAFKISRQDYHWMKMSKKVLFIGVNRQIFAFINCNLCWVHSAMKHFSSSPYTTFRFNECERR